MSLLRLCGCLAAPCPAALLAAIVLIPTAGSAPVAAQGPPAKLPPELAVIPQDSFAFLYLRPAELWQSDPVAKLRKMFPQEAEQLLKSLDGDPLDTESLTIVYPSPDTVGFLPSLDLRGRFKTRPGRFNPNGKADLPKNAPGGIYGMLLIETTVKPVTQAYVLEHVLGKGAAANKHGPRSYFTAKGPEGSFLPGAVYFVNDRTYVFAFTTEAMKWLLTKLDDPRAQGPLSAALDRSAQKRHVVLGLNTEHPGANALRRELAEAWSRDHGPLPTWAMVPLLETRSAVLTLDVGKELKLDADLRFPDAKSATRASGALEDALFLGRFLVQAFLRSERRQDMPGREEGWHLPLLQSLGEMLLPQLEKSLRRAAIVERRDVLHVQAGAILNFEALQGLSFRDDFAVIHVRVADLMRTEFASGLVKVFPDLVFEHPFRKLEEVGLPVNAIESATIVLPTSQNMFGPFGPGRRQEFKEPKTIETFEEKKIEPPPFEKSKLEKEPEKNLEKEPDKSIPKELDLDKKERELQNPADSFVPQSGFRGDDGEVVIVKLTTTKPYDRKKIMQGILGNAPREMKHRGKTYFVSSRERSGTEALHFADERTILIAPDFAMGRVLDRPALFRAKGPFADAVAAAKKKHLFVFAANLTEASVLRAKQQIAAELSGIRGRPESLEAELGRALLPLIEARSFIVSADEETGLGGKEMRVQADVTFADAGQAVACKEAAQDALTLGRLFLLSRGRMELRRSQVDNILRDDFDGGPIVFGNQVLVPGEKPVLVPRRDLQPPLVGALLLAQAEAAVRKAKIEQQDATLRAVAQGRFDFKELQAQAREDAALLVKNDTSDRLMRKSVTNMRRLVAAMHAFHEVHGKFPSSGNLSWRVHLLPFMDELGLYKEFKQNEPWDSPHNIKLLPRMPKIFAAPGIKTREPYTTHYQLITGPDTFLDGKANPRNFDGIVIVEASDPTPWTKPTDLLYDAKKPLPKLGGVFQQGFHAVDINGNANFWPWPLDEANFRAGIVGNRLRGEKFVK